MKVAFICDVLGSENNGTTVAAMNFIRSLKSKGHDVRVVCPDRAKCGQEGWFVVPTFNLGRALNRYVEKNGVTLARPDVEILKYAMRDADIVHILLPFPVGAKAVRLAKEMGKPVTASFHCQAENFTNHIFLMNSRKANDLTYRVFWHSLYNKCDAVHYPTEFIREVFESATAPTNAYVISNGVNSDFVQRDVSKPDCFKDKFVILFSGRYSKEKSHRVLIDGVSRSKYADRIQLVFAGAGPLHDKLARYAEKKLVNQPLFKFFSRDELIDVINYSDLYVHPAEIEIEAISCLEAITCGLVPVIANSPRSATRYFALGENNLFDYNNPDSLAQRIDFWLEHPEERDLCREQYLGYTTRFQQKKCMDEMEKMLLQTIERHNYGTQKDGVLYRPAQG